MYVRGKLCYLLHQNVMLINVKRMLHCPFIMFASTRYHSVRMMNPYSNYGVKIDLKIFFLNKDLQIFCFWQGLAMARESEIDEILDSTYITGELLLSSEK